MSIFDTYGIQEVCDVTFYNIDEDGNPTVPAFYLDTSKISTLEQTAENTQAIGGKGNAPLIQWDFGKEITFNVQDALFSMKSLATMYGGDAITPVEDAVTIIVRPVQGELDSENMDLQFATIYAGNQEIVIKPSDLVKPGTEPEAFEENPDVPLFQFPWDDSIDVNSEDSPLRILLDVTFGTTIIPSLVFDKPNHLIIINLPWDTTPTPEVYAPAPYLPSIPFIMRTEVFTPISNVSNYTSLKEAGWSEYYIENGKKTLKINPKIYATDRSIKTTYAANEPVLISYDIIGVNRTLILEPYFNVAIYKPNDLPGETKLLKLDHGSKINNSSYTTYEISPASNSPQNPDIIKIAATPGALFIENTADLTTQAAVQYNLNQVSTNSFYRYGSVDKTPGRTSLIYRPTTSSSWDGAIFYNKNFYITLGDITSPIGNVTLEYEGYEYFDYGSGTTSIDIKADTFPGTYYVVGDTLARGSENGEDEIFQIVIPKAKIMVDNTLTLEAGGGPSVFDFNMRVLKPGKGQPMVRLVRYDVSGEDVEKNVTLVHNHILEDKIEIEPLKLLSLTIENDIDPSSPHSIEPRFSPDNLNYTITGGSGSTSFDLVAVANENVTIIFYQEGIEKASGLGTVTHTIFDDGGKGEWTIVLDSSGETTTYIVEFV